MAPRTAVVKLSKRSQIHAYKLFDTSAFVVENLIRKSLCV
jgi:hypothetical protein